VFDPFRVVIPPRPPPGSETLRYLVEPRWGSIHANGCDLRPSRSPPRNRAIAKRLSIQALTPNVLYCSEASNALPMYDRVRSLVVATGRTIARSIAFVAVLFALLLTSWSAEKRVPFRRLPAFGFPNILRPILQMDPSLRGEATVTWLDTLWRRAVYYRFWDRRGATVLEIAAVRFDKRFDIGGGISADYVMQNFNPRLDWQMGTIGYHTMSFKWTRKTARPYAVAFTMRLNRRISKGAKWRKIFLLFHVPPDRL
jgi:hypothetical protein